MSGDVEIKFSLHPAQLAVFNSKTRFRMLVAGRRFGKTHLAIAEACCAALDPANRLKQSVYLIAPTQPQAKVLYWRPLLDKLHALITSTNVNEGLIYLNNGVVVGVKGADNPDALRGPGLYFAVLDEYASMKPYVWGEIIRPALADSAGRAMFIGTPAGRNHFYDMFMEASRGDDSEWKAWHYESIENPFLPAGEIEGARRSMSSAAFNKEFRASFETGSGGAIKAEWLKIDEIEPKKQGYWFVVVDLAGFTGVEKAQTSKQKQLDEHVIVVAKVMIEKDGTDSWWVKDVQRGRWGTKEAAKRIMDAIESAEPSAWGMERGALYNAVLPSIYEEALRRKLDLKAPVPLTHENRIKAERILWALQGRFEHGKITFNRAAWNRDAEDQLTQFPSRMVHDDIPDALSYIAQISQGRVFEDFSDVEDTPYWQPQDASIGY